MGNSSPTKDVLVPPKKECSVYYYPDYNRFQIGDSFETVVRSYFSEKFYEKVNSAITDSDPGKNAEQTFEPDLRFRHRLTGNCFWLGCKFVDRSSEGKIQWSSNEQLIKYGQFQESHRPEQVFVVLGLGGTPHRPKSLYCIPLKDITGPELCLSSIEKHRHRVDQLFRYENESVV
jgi:hypothetical protein